MIYKDEDQRFKPSLVKREPTDDSNDFNVLL